MPLFGQWNINISCNYYNHLLNVCYTPDKAVGL